jgi:hypothetical protein
MSADIVTELQDAGARQRRAGAEQRKADLAAWRAQGEAKPKKRGSPERDLQRGVVKLVRLAFPSVVLSAVANEEAPKSKDPHERARFQAARKAKGIAVGVPDITCFLPGGRVLLLELKAERGKVSAAQHLMHARLAQIGHRVMVIRSLDEAASALRAAMA